MLHMSFTTKIPSAYEEDMIDHPSYTHNLSSCEIKDWKTSDLNRIRAHDFYDTCADNCDDQSCPHNPYYEAMFSLRCAQCACGLFPVR